MYENMHSMIETVLPHEYAHAVLLFKKDFSNQNGGHTKEWRSICVNLGGKDCKRFVDRDDIVLEKLERI